MIHLDFDHPTRGRYSAMGHKKATFLEGGASFGDSGSPLLARFGDMDFIVGVASYIRGTGSPTPTGYGEITGYQWLGTFEVTSWLSLVGVEVVDDPFAAQLRIAFENAGEDEDKATETPTDLNGDAMVTPADAARLLTGLATGDADADLNGDRVLDVRDAARMLEALGYTHAVYPKKRQWNRAVKQMFKRDVEPRLIGYSKRERREAWRTLKKAYTLVGA